MNSKSFSLLTNEQKRNIFLALLLLIIPIGAKFFFVEEEAEERVKQLPQVKRFYNLKSSVDENASFFDLLINSNSEYEELSVTAGVNPDNLRKYFSYMPTEEQVEEKQAEEKKVEEPEPEVKPVVVRPVVTRKEPEKPTQKEEEVKAPNNLTFIYEGGNSSYVIIDGQLIKLGGKTQSGMTVKKIEKNRVYLEGKRSSEWVTLKF